MKNIKFGFIAIFLGALLSVSCDQLSSQKLETELDTLSYSIGVYYGNMLAKQNNVTEINGDLLGKGVNDAVSGAETILSEEEVNQFINTYFEAKHVSDLKEQYKGNIDEGLEYLEANKAKAGVKITESGLQYRIIEEGTGKSPESNDKVRVHYRGTLIDGTVFDSSYERGEPTEFGVSQVIPGWTEALMMMKEGGKWEIVIPQELAYGWRVRPGGQIEPFKTLIFEVELLEVLE